MSKKSYNQIKFEQPTIGMDVEFFFSDNKGKVVGSEKGIDIKKGFIVDDRIHDENGQSKFTCDGVQVEMNPKPSYCREVLGREIQHCLNKFSSLLSKTGLKTSFDGVVEVSKEEFDTLSAESKVFGCMPSFDAYNNGETNKITVDPTKDLTRSAGGHIHLGSIKGVVTVNGEKDELCDVCPCECKRRKHEDYKIETLIQKYGISIHDLKDHATAVETMKKLKLCTDDNEVVLSLSDTDKAVQDTNTLVRMIDLVCGIPSVLVDRDPNAAKRRKVYGKAADYRKPKHGIEYRTLSNFWIRSYVTMSLFTGLARTALLIVAEEKSGRQKGIIDWMFDGIEPKDVQTAINTNNFIMARDIWMKIKNKLCIVAGDTVNNFPINYNTVAKFEQFVIDGIDKYFKKEDTFTTWNDTSRGWETWVIDNLDSYDGDFSKVEKE